MTQSHEEAERAIERLLVLRAQAGDRSAFGELVTRYQERLMYFVHRLVHDAHRSRDVLQEVWLDVFRTIGKLQSPAAFRVWLYRIAHNRSVTLIRRQILESDARVQLAVEADEVDAGSDFELLENAELVHFALDKLSAIHREVMTLRFLEDMNIEEISRVTGCSEGTAKSRLHYAKHELRRLIGEEQGHV